MRCSINWKVLVSAYADGELDAAQAAQVRAHLGECQTCRELLQQWGDNQSLFTWAYSQQIDEENTVCVKESPKVSSEIPEMKPRKSLSKRDVVRRSLAWAAVLVLCVLLGQLAIWSRLPSMGGEGSMVVTTSQIQKTRLVWGVTLNIGPNSQVMRTGPRSIKLIKGWVEASVTGRPIQISTKRVSITDMGTRFEVGSGPQLDYVKVSKGWVWVSCGGKQLQVGKNDVMYALSGQAPVVSHTKAQAPPPARQSKLIELPEELATTDTLIMKSGRQKLQTRYPDLTWTGSSSSKLWQDDKVIVFGYSELSDLSYRVQQRQVDILRGIIGSGDTRTNWQIPTGMVVVSGIKQFNDGALTPCLLQLECLLGNLRWSLTDTNSNQLSFAADALSTKSSYGDTGQLTSSARWVLGRSLPGLASMSDSKDRHGVWIGPADWPGSLKPEISLSLDWRSRHIILPKEAEVKASVIKQLAGRADCPLSTIGDTLTYLGKDHSDYFSVYLNDKLHDEVTRFKSGISQGFVLGVFTTSRPLQQPKAPAGNYLIRYGRNADDRKPQLLLEPTNEQTVRTWNRKRADMTRTTPRKNSSWQYGCSQGDQDLTLEMQISGTGPYVIQLTVTASKPNTASLPTTIGELTLE